MSRNLTNCDDLSVADRRLQVAYLTQWFPPEPANNALGIAQSLRREGLGVEVLTGTPNYPTGVVQEGYSPWRRSSEFQDGFRVVRMPLYPSHDRSTLKRAANYISYALSSTALGTRTLRSADVALVYSSPATAATAAMAAHRRWRVPYVLLVMDLWPDSVFAAGFLSGGIKGRLAHASLTSYTRAAYGRASHIAVTSPGMRERLLDRGILPDKVSVIYNWVDEKIMRPAEPDNEMRGGLGIGNDFLLMYAGNHGAAQALEVTVRAMGLLRDLPDAHLVLVGDGIEKPALRRLVSDLDLKTVHFLDSVDSGRMPALMAAADLQLVSLTDHDLFRITLPSKVQAILACGQPILACAAGDSARVVENSGAGFTCSPGDPGALASAIRSAYGIERPRLRAMGRKGRTYYASNLSEAVNANQLARLLRSAAGMRQQGSHVDFANPNPGRHGNARAYADEGTQ